MEGSDLLKTYNLPPTWLQFNPKVREQCKSCKRHGKKATCPPFVGTYEYYKTLLPTYNNGTLYIMDFEIINQDSWKTLGETSSNQLRGVLIEDRNKLTRHGKFAVAFGAGSCKQCAECQLPNCRFPNLALIPIEATGINVKSLVATCANISLEFPVTNKFYRVGMLLWD
jgi:predicted metal-binding protein